MPTLILTSEHDLPGAKDQAYRLRDQISGGHIPVELMEFKGEGHFIPFEKRNPVIDAFLKKWLTSGE